MLAQSTAMHAMTSTYVQQALLQLVDVNFYSRLCKTFFDSPAKAVAHYLKTGNTCGHSLCPLFDHEFYSSQLQDENSQPLLVHYLLEGEKTGLRPNPLFDPLTYIHINVDVNSEKISPLVHYRCYGAAERRIPSLVFHPEFVQQNAGPGLPTTPHTLMANILVDDRFRRVSFHPLIDAEHLARRIPVATQGVRNAGVAWLLDPSLHHISPSRWFDSKFYIAQLYANEKMRNPVEHFIAWGILRGLDPSPSFSTIIYCAHHPQWGEHHRDPLSHYIMHGCNAQLSPINIERNSVWNQPFKSTRSLWKSTRVLIVADIGLVQCYHYRVEQKKMFFDIIGVEAIICSEEDSEFFSNQVQLASLVIFYRVTASPRNLYYILECRRLGLPTLFEIDDLIFERALYAEHADFSSVPKKLKEKLIEDSDSYLHLLRLTNGGIASTVAIAEKMTNHMLGPVHIIENGLTSLPPRRVPQATNDGMLYVGYGSGTTTHDLDFRVVARALAQVMESQPNVRLVLFGHLQLPSELEKHSHAVVQVAFTGREEYCKLASNLNVALAPLEVNPFTSAKSNIKYLEAAANCVPIITSDTEPFRAAIKDGDNGFIARNEKEWIDKLSKLLSDPGFRVAMGQNAYDHVSRRYTGSYIAQQQIVPMLRQLGVF